MHCRLVYGLLKKLKLRRYGPHQKKWRGVDLNHRPVGYEPIALSG